MLLYLIRHGETLWNREHRFQGWLDIPLNEVGLQQARQVAGRMAGLTGVRHLWSSPLQRSFVTARQVGAAMGLTPQSVPALREINMGSWAGRPTPELLAGPAGDTVRRWLSGDPDVVVPEGESIRMVCQRTLDGITPLLATAHGDAVIVAHGLSLKALIFGLLALPLTYDTMFDLDNASVSVLRLTAGKPAKLLLLNDTGHLDDPAGNGAFWETDL